MLSSDRIVVLGLSLALASIMGVCRLHTVLLLVDPTASGGGEESKHSLPSPDQQQQNPLATDETQNSISKKISATERKRMKPRNAGRINKDSSIIIPVLPPKHYPVPVEVSFRGVAGLGHRLFRQSSAYHLAKGLYLDSLTVDWGWCYTFDDPKNASSVTSHVDIFPYLFGNTTIPIPQPEQSEEPSLPLVSLPFIQAIRWNNTLLESNNYATVKLEYINAVKHYNDKEYTMLDMRRNNHYGKDQSDLEMYRTMIRHFQHGHRVDYWKEELQFHNHSVIGLHIRQGNGERGDFRKKNRGIHGVSEEEWIWNLAELLLNFIQSRNGPGGTTDMPPLIVLATDRSNATQLALQLENGFSRAAMLTTNSSTTSDSIPRVVTAMQDRVPEGEGVSYQYMFETKEDCLEGWIAQMVDMILLAESNVVVAGQYSSFTQTMPLSFQFGKTAQKLSKPENSPNGMFCNVGATATTMKCFTDFGEWMAQKSKMPLIGNPIGQKPEHENLIPMPVHTMTLRKTLQQKLRNLPLEIVTL